MTHEEILKQAERAIPYYKKQIEIMQAIIAAVEKQIPRKPNDTKNVLLPKCPNCGKRFFPSKYCDVCGQRLDWSK